VFAGTAYVTAFSTGTMDGDVVAGLATQVPGSYRKIADIADQDARAEWYASYAAEGDPLIANGTLKPVPRTPDMKVLPLHELMHVKASGRKKTRFAVGGNHTTRGEDYEESTSPTVHWKSNRTVLSVAGAEDMDLTTVDISQAYPRASLAPGEQFFCEIPRGYRHLYKDAKGEPMVAECGNLYGLPPAGRNWYLHVTSTDPHTGLRGCPVAGGLEQSQDDPCVLTAVNEKGERIIICLYVDDMLIATTKGSGLKQEFLEWLGKAYDYTGGESIGPDGLSWLGARILKVDGGYKLESSRYIHETLAKYVPGGHHAHYSVPASKDLPRVVADAADAKCATVDKTAFKSCLGELQYLACSTRPDITYTVGMLSRCQEWPTEACMKAAEQCAIYLYHTADIGITYSKRSDTTLSWLFGMSDADWSLSNSTSGWCFSVLAAVVSYGSKKQKSIALSTCEAEIMASSLAACEAVFLRNLLAFLGVVLAGATTLYMDSTGAERVAKNHVMHHVAKHMARRDLKVRELVECGVVKPAHINTKDNLADLFTKPLDRKTFQGLRNVLMNITP